MSDDPASIESWQQQMQDDIVTQLRNHIAITTRMHYAKDGFPEPVFVHGPSPICQEAADEIERLRRKLLGEENAYDILRLENERLRAELVSVTNKLNLERDEGVVEIERIRKECFHLAANQCHAGYGGEYGHHRCADIDRLTKERDEARRSYCYATGNGEEQRAINVAQSKGWDCFKEDGKPCQ